ncbi:hypothetical protein WG66_014771 [Moniliophthora roreri]|nr:hypothetical protein WG66_014771 [Moniliophthora roreri]
MIPRYYKHHIIRMRPLLKDCSLIYCPPVWRSPSSSLPDSLKGLTAQSSCQPLHPPLFGVYNFHKQPLLLSVLSERSLASEISCCLDLDHGHCSPGATHHSFISTSYCALWRSDEHLQR